MWVTQCEPKRNYSCCKMIDISSSLLRVGGCVFICPFVSITLTYLNPINEFELQIMYGSNYIILGYIHGFVRFPDTTDIRCSDLVHIYIYACLEYHYQ